MSGINLVGGAIELTHDGRTWRYESPAALAQRVCLLEVLLERVKEPMVIEQDFYCRACEFEVGHAEDCPLPLLMQPEVES